MGPGAVAGGAGGAVAGAGIGKAVEKSGQKSLDKIEFKRPGDNNNDDIWHCRGHPCIVVASIKSITKISSMSFTRCRSRRRCPSAQGAAHVLRIVLDLGYDRVGGKKHQDTI